MIEKALSLLGIARRAGKLSLGHDAAKQSIIANSAKLCLCSADGSQRLQNEMKHACEYNNKNIPFRLLDCGSEQLSKAVGQKLSILTVDDEGFAAAIIKHIEKG